MMDVTGKKILLVANKFFGIEANIKKALEERGATVDYYDERPGNSFLTKALIRLRSGLIRRHVDKYHSKLITETIHVKYEYIIFIKGESFSFKNLQSLFESHREAKTIVYHWDSIVDNANALNLLPLFDKKYSFDREDCKKYGMDFLPLFYYDEYCKIKESNIAPRYDLMFVGTAHYHRYRIINRVASQFKEIGRTVFLYFFFQSKLMYYKYIIQHKEARKMPKNQIHFDKVGKEELLRLYSLSKTVVDVCKPKQGGLTLRCMEALGAGRKLITTNRDIVNYDFYNSNNILVIDPDKPEVTQEFIESEYVTVDRDIYERYSLSHWIERLLSL